MSYLLSGLDLVVNSTTNIIVNTNPITIQGDIVPSEKIISVNSSYNRFSRPDNTPATVITSTSIASSLTNVTAKAIGTTQVPITPTYTSNLNNNLNITYDGEYYVKLLLGTASASSSILDISNNNYSIINSGATAAALNPFGSGSTYNSLNFNGTSSYLSIDNPISTLLGAEDFTVEFFIYATSFSNLPVIIDTNSNLGFQYWQVSLTATGQVQFTYTYGTTAVNVTTTSTLTLSTWAHVAIVRNNTVQKPGNNFNIYINGVSGVSALIANNWGDVSTNASSVVIGKKANNTLYFTGNLSNLRITQSAVYKGAFTKPSATLGVTQVASTNIDLIPPGRKVNTRYSTTSIKSAVYEPVQVPMYNALTYSNLTGQTEVYDPYLISNSLINTYIAAAANKNIKSDTEIFNVSLSPEFYVNGPDAPNILSTEGQSAITSNTTGALTFNNNLASVSYSTDLQAVNITADFTVEFWIKPINWNQSVIERVMGSYGSSRVGWYIWKSGTAADCRRLSVTFTGTGGVTFVSTNDVTSNVWQHWALVRSGSTLSWFKDGILDSSTTMTRASNIDLTDFTTPFTLGTGQVGIFADRNSAAFNISNLRIVKGTALYSGTFTPKTPLIDTANTTLFLPVTDNATKLLETVGGDTLSSSNVVFTNLGPVINTSTTTTTVSGAGSLLFNGSNYLSATKTGGWLSSDHTVEAWIYPTALPNPADANQYLRAACIAGEGSLGTGAWEFWIQPNAIAVGYRTTGIVFISSSFTFATNTWYHVAFSRSGSTVRVFVNGVEIANGTITAWTPQSGLNIGRNGITSFIYPFEGYISNFRIVSTAIYVSNFTPTVPLKNITNTQLLLLVSSDANKLVDSSTNNYTLNNNNAVTYTNSIVPSVYKKVVVDNPGASISSGGGYFAGGSSNQRLSIASSSAFDLSGGTWTIEFWMYSTATPTSGNQCRILMFGTNSTNTAFYVGYNSDGSIQAAVPFSGATGIAGSSSAISLNSWYHVAVVSTAGSTKIFINGTQSGTTATITQPVSSSPTLNIGYDTVAAANFQYQGYLSNVRVLNGTAVYTGNFTVPTTPLTLTQNASTNIKAILSPQVGLLTLQNPSTIIDNSDIHSGISNTGVTVSSDYHPTWTGSTNLITTGGASFNGINQYLTVPSGASNWGAGDFTVECWFYKTSALDGTLMSNAGATGTSYWELFSRASGTCGFQIRDATNQIFIEGSIVSPINKWVHVAAVRDAGVVKVFVNGVLDNSGTNTKTITNRTTFIGSFQVTGFLNYYPGYISNVRLVSGLAVYLGNFTVPTSPLTKIQNSGTNINAITGSLTSVLTLQDNTITDYSDSAYVITDTGSITASTVYGPILGVVSSSSTNYAPGSYVSTSATNETIIEYINYRTDPRSVNKRVKNLIVGTTGVIEELQSWS